MMNLYKLNPTSTSKNFTRKHEPFLFPVKFWDHPSELEAPASGSARVFDTIRMRFPGRQRRGGGGYRFQPAHRACTNNRKSSGEMTIVLFSMQREFKRSSSALLFLSRYNSGTALMTCADQRHGSESGLFLRTSPK